MAIIIKLSFLAGRYHATPWGRHVNEGIAEWPPSPWRLLRALVAVWKRTRPHLLETQVRRVLEALADPPRFALPPHRVAHTRHAMPINVIQRMYKPSAVEKKAGKYQGDPTIVFDTFVCIDRTSSLYIGWPDVELGPDDHATLAQLLENLSSLGRAESWVSAELTEENIELDFTPTSRDDNDPLRVLCADPTAAFGDAHYPRRNPKKPTDYLFDCPRWHLCLDTQTIHAARSSMVPGAKWVGYSRPTEHRSIHTTIRPVTSSKPTIAEFLLDGAVLPLMNNTVQIAEDFRDAIMSVFGTCCVGREEAAQYLRADGKHYASPTFSGKDKDGQRLTNHLHAHYLPIQDKIAPRHVRKVVVYAPIGFEGLEVTALKRLRSVRLGKLNFRVWLSSLGNASTLPPDLYIPSSAWVSVTPFIAHRHAKKVGRKHDVPTNPDDPSGSFLAIAAHEMCQKIGLPILEAQPVNAAKGQLQFYEFRRARRKAGDNAYTRTTGYLRLTFSKPVFGPLCLGYNSHFGMGLFKPVSDGHHPIH